jgi:hypothetical protein
MGLDNPNTYFSRETISKAEPLDTLDTNHSND